MVVNLVLFLSSQSVKLDVLEELIVKIGSVPGIVLFSTLMRTSWCASWAPARRRPTLCRLRRQDRVTEPESEVEQGALDAANKTIVNTSAGIKRPGTSLSTCINIFISFLSLALHPQSLIVRACPSSALTAAAWPAEAMSDNFVVLICKTKVEREGSNLMIVTHSKMVIHIMDPADLLAKEGFCAKIINLRSIRPLDNDTIKASESVKKSNR
ncbi:hypothetical protein DFJ58DRAFT_730613 [Suillus subalutaceus]|uniref:uncharacterized protein n=1 Tax=Suillus subalutaceus TaxID=48586 RepID=UPI001B87E135|nr:uncharacterized protein DFJ58DRAFT_730613 [Suillus subalutaceus]KAG1846233.1 hypothetical protein DFJ58DRAFT_730613 [Suillus subalutaceus]